MMDAYVINLDHRKDRWEETKPQLEDAGFNVNRFSACYGKEHSAADNEDVVNRFWGNPGYIGSLVSRRELYRDLRGEGIVAVFEDDVELVEGFDQTFRAGMDELPENWMMCYLGWWVPDREPHPKSYSNSISRVDFVKSVHAVITTETGREAVLERFEENWLMETNDDSHQAVQDPDTWFCFDPPVAYQRPSYSDITGEYEDYRERML